MSAAALRLLLVGPLPPPSGGMANQTRQLAALLGAEGLRVHVVQNNAPYSPQWVGRIPVIRAFFRLIPFALQLWRRMKEADVVHVMANSGWAWFFFAAPAIRIANWQSVPVVVNYRGGLAREFLSQRSRWVLPTLKKAQCLIVPSAFLQGVFAEYRTQARTIPNIVDVKRFSPGQPSDRSSTHVVIARNLESIYGIDTAIRAVALLRKQVGTLRVSIAGSGVERAALEQLARDLGVDDVVRFTGRLEVDQMAELYRDADIVLNPSRVDNTPNSILEALACGVPVVSTNVGGIPFLVEHERTAWLIGPDDPQAMADAMHAVIGDRGLRARLREAGLALARSCSWDAVKQQWIECYTQLAGRRTA